MALQPAFGDGPDEGALRGVVDMVWGRVLESAGRVGVGGESAHGCRCCVCCRIMLRITCSSVSVRKYKVGALGSKLPSTAGPRFAAHMAIDTRAKAMTRAADLSWQALVNGRRLHLGG